MVKTTSEKGTEKTIKTGKIDDEKEKAYYTSRSSLHLSSGFFIANKSSPIISLDVAADPAHGTKLSAVPGHEESSAA